VNVSVKTRRIVFERDGEMCMHCGTTTTLTIQHRRNRGMGGDKAGLRNNLANLITLCNESNTRLESDAVFARSGIRKGWKLTSGQSDIDTPVMHRGFGEWWFIDNNGDRHVIGTENF
jgi:hypothetical protein